MRKILSVALLLAMVCAFFAGSGCLLEEKVIQIVLSHATCVEFAEREDNESFTTPATINYADKIDEILEDNDLERADVDSMVIATVTYEVTYFPPPEGAHDDWELTGGITVERQDVMDGPAILVDLTTVSVLDALNNPTAADLNPAGVAVLNRAIADYRAGWNPVLTFIVDTTTGDVEPDPSPADSLIFDWKACVKMQVISELDFEAFELF